MSHARDLALVASLAAIAFPALAAQSASEAAAAANARKLAQLKNIGRDLDASSAPFMGRGMVTELQRKLAALPVTAPLQQRSLAHLAVADALLGFGRIEEAIAEYELGVADATKSGDPHAQAVALRRLALGWLRLGERANCITRHNHDSCIFPLRDGGLHVDREGSTKAIECLERALAADESDLASCWLLNVAHMTLGSWPDGVPERWRIPAAAIASEHPMPRMFDVAPKLGLDRSSRAGGSILDDFDGDGNLDILTTSLDLARPAQLFVRKPDGSWTDVAEERGLGAQLGCFYVVQFDANNDGRLDLLMQRGAWMGDFGKIPNSLVVQLPDGTFADRTKEAGMEFLAPSQVACVADIDLDGDLDVFLGYENLAGEKAIRYPCRLLRNRGDATFEEIAQQAGVVNGRFCKGAAFGDWDGDGLPDLYVSNMGSQDRLYHNEGGCRFKDVSAELGVRGPPDSFSCWFFDYDDDGDLDLFVGCYDAGDRGAQMAAFYKDGVLPKQMQKLYENDGRGGFRDVTAERGLARVAFPMGSNFGDVDGDGFPDLYLSTGDPDLSSLWPNVMYRNGEDGKGGRRFEDVTAATGTGHLQKGHGVSFGDVDGDGDQDLLVQLGGAVADDGFADVLFENPGHGNHWLTVRLIGRSSNRFGVGSRVKVTIQEEGSEEGKTRDVFHFVGTNSSFGGNSLQAEMGLGRASRVVALEVSWPKTKQTQRFETVPLDCVVVVDEARTDLELLPPAPPRPLLPPEPVGAH